VGAVAATNTATGSTYNFVDNGAVNGTTYEYTLSTVNVDGSVESWGLVETATPSSDAAVITEYALHQNYPNPFNPSTLIAYTLPTESRVALEVFSITGAKVATLVNEVQGSGFKSVEFHSAGLASGVYVYKLTAGNVTLRRKMMLAK
jgi:hypothetical protein